MNANRAWMQAFDNCKSTELRDCSFLCTGRTGTVRWAIKTFVCLKVAKY